MTAILDQYGAPIRTARNPRGGRRSIQARYDLAQTTDQNSAHWANADALDADSANTLGIRKRLRERARYEVANNSYLKGVVLTLANHEVGTGPTLQVQTKSVGFNAMLEAKFSDWAEAIGLAEKLRTMVQARVVDGEVFGLLTTNEANGDPVTLDFVPIECDRVTSPRYYVDAPDYIDGIHFDTAGNATGYDVLTYHPGATYRISGFWDYRTAPAAFVTHLFRADRPGQHRGIPEIMPALALLPGLRRFTQATIKAAEVAADISLAFETDLQPGELPDEIDPGTVEIPMGTMFQAPYGWKAKQIAAEHPNAMFQEFRRGTINEAARCVNMPPNIAMCDSADYNFASGRLDHQTYFASVGISQSHTARKVLRPIFAAWFQEAAKVYDWTITTAAPPPFRFYWVGQPYCDPESEANAILTNLGSGMTSYAAEYARRGLDWENEFIRQAEALGITLEEYQALVRNKIFGSAIPKPPPPGQPAETPVEPPAANGRANGRFSMRN